MVQTSREVDEMISRVLGMSSSAACPTASVEDEQLVPKLDSKYMNLLYLFVFIDCAIV
jgi:hypothetical protein